MKHARQILDRIRKRKVYREAVRDASEVLRSSDSAGGQTVDCLSKSACSYTPAVNDSDPNGTCDCDLFSA